MLLLLADSQVGRVWRLVSNDREAFRQGSFVSVLKDAQRVDAIGAITAQVSEVIISCITNHICDQLHNVSDDRSAALNQLFQEWFHGPDGLFNVCALLPKVSFFMAPPNVRSCPSWYPHIRKEALRVIEVEVAQGPDNFYLLPDFDGVLERDGVHFCILDGIRYAKHLADESARILAQPNDSRRQSAASLTQVVQGALINGLSERVNLVEAKLDDLDARTSEESDNCANERELHRFMIIGLARLTKPTQDELRKQVYAFVKQLSAGITLDDIVWVRVVRSSTSQVSNVECRTVAAAQLVKSSFAAHVKSASPPAFIGKVSISYCHTLGTRVRLSIFRSIVKRQKEKDTNAIVSVTTFTARPVLRVGSQGKGTRFLSYVEAVKGYGHLLTQADLDRAASMCKSMKGTLRARFLILSDDRELPPPPARQKRSADAMDVETGPPAPKR